MWTSTSEFHHDFSGGVDRAACTAATLDSAIPATIQFSPLVPAWKRVLDITLVVLTCVAWMPLMAILAMGIKLVSKGPVFFKQERVGLQGRRFMLFKFRTMHLGADPRVHQEHLNHLIQAETPMTKLDQKQDSRLIPGASLLRAGGLDELPQLFNVLRGDMSLVGPRPCLPYEYDKYLPWHKRRLDTLPGLTGWWQVNGKNKTTFSEMVQLDIDYVNRKSLVFDLYIISKTFSALAGQVQEATRNQGKT